MKKGDVYDAINVSVSYLRNLVSDFSALQYDNSYTELYKSLKPGF
ncbi:MAG TPA: hypothetical protein V6C58_15640 [Allocoleopsis sp.]